MNVLVILVVLFALYALIGRLLKHAALRGLVCTRAFSQPAVFEGEEGEMVEIVRNDRPIIVPWLRVESRISPYLQLGRQENLLVSGSTHFCSLFTLMPYQQIKRRHRVRFLHRGEYNLGNATLTAGDILGWFQTTREQEMNVPVLVYPRLLDEKEIPAPLSRLMGDMVSRRQLLTDPFLVRGIRAYQIGDPVRDIHWPATARMGCAQVRVHEYAAQPRLLVVLNCERTDDQWGARLMDYEQGEIEYGISMAATLCMRALHSGLAVGFAANMPLSKEEGCTLMLPSGGAAREEELLSAFARLTILRSLSFHTFLDTLTAYSGLDILVLSCFDHDRIQAAMTRLRRAGNQVELYLLEGKQA